MIDEQFVPPDGYALALRARAASEKETDIAAAKQQRDREQREACAADYARDQLRAFRNEYLHAEWRAAERPPTRVIRNLRAYDPPDPYAAGIEALQEQAARR